MGCRPFIATSVPQLALAAAGFGLVGSMRGGDRGGPLEGAGEARPSDGIGVDWWRASAGSSVRGLDEVVV